MVTEHLSHLTGTWRSVQVRSWAFMEKVSGSRFFYLRVCSLLGCQTAPHSPSASYRYSRYSDRLRASRPRDQISSPCMVKNFLFSTLSSSALGSTKSPTRGVRGGGAFSRGINRPGREADHSPPASAEIKKIWIYTSTLPYVFMA
jgi:hypothetical protein